MRLLSIALMSIVAVGGSAEAFRLVETSLDEKVATASLVVIARVTAVDPSGANGRRCKFNKLAIEQTLKGASASIVEVGQAGFSESRIPCLVIGARYLMFLTKNSQGQFISVNGPFGVYRVDVRPE